MSEKNGYNEIIYLLPKFQKIVDNWYRSVEFASNAKLDDNQVAYILKQTHDKEVADLKAKFKELEELRAKTFSEYMQLSVENEELKAEIEMLKATINIHAKHFKPASDFYNKK